MQNLKRMVKKDLRRSFGLRVAGFECRRVFEGFCLICWNYLYLNCTFNGDWMLSSKSWFIV